MRQILLRYAEWLEEIGEKTECRNDIVIYV